MHKSKKSSTSHHASRTVVTVGVLIAVAILLFTGASCGSDGGGVPVLSALHDSIVGSPGDDPLTDATVEADAIAAPSWCEDGRDLEAIHLHFHSAGDEMPDNAVVERAVEASQAVEQLVADTDFASEATLLREAMEIARAEGSVEVFGGEPYRSAATAVFDRIEANCT